MAFISVRQIAMEMGVSRQWIYALMSRGELPHARIGRRIVVPSEAWTAYTAAKTREALGHCTATDAQGRDHA